MHTLHTTDDNGCRREEGGPHTLHTQTLLREVIRKIQRKAQICLSYPKHTLHTTISKRILCIPDSLLRKSRSNAKINNLGNFIPRAGVGG